MDLRTRQKQIDIFARDIERFVHVCECGIDVLEFEAGGVLFPVDLCRRSYTVRVGVTIQAMEDDTERDEQHLVERHRRQREPEAQRVDAQRADNSC